jgi:hypothetical protein
MMPDMSASGKSSEPYTLHSDGLLVRNVPAPLWLLLLLLLGAVCSSASLSLIMCS